LSNNYSPTSQFRDTLPLSNCASAPPTKRHLIKYYASNQIVLLSPVGRASEPFCCCPIGLGRAGKQMEIFFVMLIIVAIVFTVIGLLIGYFLWHE